MRHFSIFSIHSPLLRLRLRLPLLLPLLLLLLGRPLLLVLLRLLVLRLLLLRLLLLLEILLLLLLRYLLLSSPSRGAVFNLFASLPPPDALLESNLQPGALLESIRIRAQTAASSKTSR